MPKNTKVYKVDNVLKRQRVPSKFRIGTRKAGKSAHLMSTQALLDVLAGPHKKNAKNAKQVLELRNYAW